MSEAIFTRCVNPPNVMPIEKGGTSGTTTNAACINLGLGDINQMDFSANSYNDWVSAVQSYVDQNLQTRRPFAFHAGWQGIGYGSGLAYYTLDSGFKFLMLFNENEHSGVKYYFKRPGENWVEASVNRGTVLYSNSSGTKNTVTLSDSLSNYSNIDIEYTVQGRYMTSRIYNPNGRWTTILETSGYADSLFYRECCLSMSGSTIAFQTERTHWGYFSNGGTTSVHNEIDLSITKVIGHK